MRDQKRLCILLFLLPAVIVFIAIYLVPLVTVIATSLCNWNGFDNIEFVGLDNYVELFSADDTFRSALKNTVIWGLCATFIHVPFGVLIALVLFRKPRGWRFVRSSYMLYNVMSRSALAIIFVFLFNPEMGIINGFVRLIGDPNFSHNWLFDRGTALMSVTLTWLPYAGLITLITLSELFSISPSIYEAAMIDGGTNLQIDWYINLPLLRKTIATGVIIAVTAVFKEFDILFMTTSGGPGNATINLSLMIYNNIFNSYRYGYANAVAVTLIVLGILSMLLINRISRLDEKIN